MTKLLHQRFSLLTASPNGQVWRSFDQARPEYDPDQLLMILTFVAIVVTMGLLLVRMRSQFQTDSKRALFSELCRAHGLNASSRRLLKRLAAARRLSHAATLFVEPQYFDTSDMSPALQAAMDELQRLRDQIFR